MTSMDSHRLISRIPWTYLCWMTVLLLVLGYSVFSMDKLNMHLMLNAYHRPWMDTLMCAYTQVGEWVPYVVVVVLLLYKLGWSLFLLSEVLLSGLMTRGLKLLLNTPRPITLFAEQMPDVPLPLVDGYEMAAWYSMPSGHMTTFVALMMTLCLISNSDHLTHKSRCPKCMEYLLETLAFVLTVLGGYSRIYLNMHFAEDILVGAVVGMVAMVIGVVVLRMTHINKVWDWNLGQLLVFLKKNA